MFLRILVCAVSSSIVFGCILANLHITPSFLLLKLFTKSTVKSEKNIALYLE